MVGPPDFSKLPNATPKESEIRRMTRMAAEYGAVNLSQGFPNEGPHFDAKFGLISGVVGGSPEAADKMRTLKLGEIMEHVSESSSIFDVLKAANQKLGFPDELNQYSIPYGRKDLRDEIRNYYRRFYQYDIDPESELTVCLGATEAMASSFRTVLSPGQQVLIFEPFHELYPNQAAVFYLESVFVRLEENFEKDEWEVDWGGFEEKMGTGKVGAVILNLPHNPSGKVWRHDELERILRRCQETGAWVITDEIYEHIIYDGLGPHTIIPRDFPWIRDQCILINSISKNASATGWRVGWVVTPPSITPLLRAVHDQMVLQAPSPCQYGTLKMLQLPEEYFNKEIPEKYLKRRSILVDGLRELGFKLITPHSAYYIFANFRGVKKLEHFSDIEACEFLCKTAKVATVRGTNFFGGEHEKMGGDHVRFCFVRTPETLREALENLKRHLL